MKLKAKVFQLIDGGDQPKIKWNQILETFIIGLIILSIAAIILESFKEINERLSVFFHLFEAFSITVFTLEYMLRIWTADLKFADTGRVRARLKFIFSGPGLIDLIAILPFFLPFAFQLDLRFVRILRVVRLLRIFKLNRYSRGMILVAKVVAEKRSELSITIFVTSILLLLSSTIMYYLEGDVQPEAFPNIIATFWWAIATLTTVGYGDVYPVTGWGKFISGIIALLGIGLVALPTGIISAAFIEEVEKEKRQEQPPAAPFNYCPHCGKSLDYQENRPT